MIISLKSSNYETLRVTAGSAKTKGTNEVINDVTAFAFNDAASGDLYEAVYKAGLVEAPKDTNAINAGEKVYLHVASDFITATSTGAVLVGIAKEDFLAGALTVDFEFDQTVNA